MTNYYSRINYVEEIEIDGRLVKGNEQLRIGFMKFFCRLYREEISWRSMLDGLTLLSLDEWRCELL